MVLFKYSRPIAVAIMAATLTSPVITHAQSGLEEIVVTAQRRAQSLQDVPISIQAITGDEMVRQGFRTMNDMSVFSPGLVVKVEEEEQGLMVRGAGLFWPECDRGCIKYPFTPPG